MNLLEAVHANIEKSLKNTGVESSWVKNYKADNKFTFTFTNKYENDSLSMFKIKKLISDTFFMYKHCYSDIGVSFSSTSSRTGRSTISAVVYVDEKIALAPIKGVSIPPTLVTNSTLLRDYLIKYQVSFTNWKTNASKNRLAIIYGVLEKSASNVADMIADYCKNNYVNYKDIVVSSPKDGVCTINVIV